MEELHMGDASLTNCFHSLRHLDWQYCIRSVHAYVGKLKSGFVS